MEHDRLNDLIFDADRAAPPPVVAPGLATRVLLRARRRAMRQRAVVALALAGSCGLAIFRLMPKPPLSVKPPPAGVAEIRAELARLDAEARRHQRAANEASGRQTAFSPATDFLDLAPEPRALQQIGEARDRAALTLLRWADRTAAESGDPGNAVMIYADAAHLFPNSPAGRIAAERLKPARKQSNS